MKLFVFELTKSRKWRIKLYAQELRVFYPSHQPTPSLLNSHSLNFGGHIVPLFWGSWI